MSWHEVAIYLTLATGILVLTVATFWAIQSIINRR